MVYRIYVFIRNTYIGIFYYVLNVKIEDIITINNCEIKYCLQLIIIHDIAYEHGQISLQAGPSYAVPRCLSDRGIP